MLYISGGLVSGQERSLTVVDDTDPRQRSAARGDHAGAAAPDRRDDRRRARRRWRLGGSDCAGSLRTDLFSPAYVLIDIADTGTVGPVMVRGGQTKLRLPVLPDDEAGLGQSGLYYAQITAVANPRFDFDNFSYLDTWYASGKRSVSRPFSSGSAPLRSAASRRR